MIYNYKVKPSTTNSVEFELIDGGNDIFRDFYRMSYDSFFEWLDFNSEGKNVFVSRTLLSDTATISKLAIVDPFQYDYFKFYIEPELFSSPLFKIKYKDFFYYHTKYSCEDLEKISLSMKGKLDYTLNYFLSLYHNSNKDCGNDLVNNFNLQPYEFLYFCDLYKEKIIGELSKIEFKNNLLNQAATYISVSMCQFLGLGIFDELLGFVPTIVVAAVSSAVIYPLIFRSYLKNSKVIVTKKVDSLVSALRQKYFIMSYDDEDSPLQIESNPVLKFEHKEKGL